MRKWLPTPDAIQLFHEGQIALSEVERAGVRIDKDYLEATLASTAERIKSLEDGMRADPLYKTWRKRYGDNTNLSSSEQMSTVVIRDLGLQPKFDTDGKEWTADSGKRASASKSSLEEIDHPFVKSYFEMQQLKKGRDTFLVGIHREMIQHDDGDWFVHPSFHLNTVSSFRSSGSDPNVQNQPTRDPALAEMVRRCYLPYRGYHILELDYCLHPDTKVKTIDGDKRIGDVEKGDKVFSLHGGRIWWSEVTHSGFVGGLPSYRVTFDNGESVIASAGHRWPVRVKPPNPVKMAGWGGGGRVVVEKTTEELLPGDRMVPCRVVCNDRNGYVHLYSSSAFNYTKEHLVVADALYGSCPVGHETHHKDGDKKNNHPDNLEYLEVFKHQRDHARQKWAGMSEGQRRKKVEELVVGSKKCSRAGSNNGNYGNRKGSDANCLYCDKVFYAPPCMSKKYCNQKCYWNARRGGLNHKVISVEFVGVQPSHGITVEPDHNYVLSCGVVTCNSQQEVRISVCYNHDPNLKNYICDPTTDMHRDVGEQIFMLKRGQLSKAARHVAKNQLVFPTFYGSYYAQMTPNIWDASASLVVEGPNPKPMRQHLAEHGITSRGACDPNESPVTGTFEYHIKEIEDHFWGERFAVYAQWKKDWYEAYLRNGGCRFLTGFIMKGPHAKNDVTNYAIQGSSFHCLLWAMVRIVNRLRRYKMKSRVFGEVHDSLMSHIHPRERDNVIEMSVGIMTEEIKRWAPWLNVPLSCEPELCPIDAPWFFKYPLKKVGGTWIPADKEKWEKNHGCWSSQC